MLVREDGPLLMKMRVSYIEDATPVLSLKREDRVLGASERESRIELV